ncbi:hypothetical protein HYV57_04155 [Candidatus Peregrinibacteria bacterium]|nr:hypothetical protein [Candidatus Peregrinibacteria bacterium]
MSINCVNCNGTIGKLVSSREIQELSTLLSTTLNDGIHPDRLLSKYSDGVDIPIKMFGVNTSAGPFCLKHIGLYRRALNAVLGNGSRNLSNGDIRKKVTSHFESSNSNGASADRQATTPSFQHLNGFDIARDSSRGVTKIPRDLKPGETDDTIRTKFPRDPHSDPSLEEILRNLRGKSLSEAQEVEI